MDQQLSFKESDTSSNGPNNEEPFVVLPDSDGEGDLEGFVEVGKETESSGGKKGKKLTSAPWNTFEVVMVKGVKRAKCKDWSTLISYSGASGTSHLNKHAKHHCTGRHLRLSGGQSQLKFKNEDDGTTSLALKEQTKKLVFDQDISRRDLVKMVVIHEYPLSIVDHFGFRSFVKSLNDNFKMISRNTLKSDVVKMYNNERGSLKALLEANEARVAITTDMWTASNQKKGYMAVTSHFIDHNWVLHNRTIRFCYVPSPYTNGVIAKILMESLSQYSLENKISSVVVDNCSTNDAMINVLLDKLESSCLVLNGDFVHMRCSAHILNLIVKDGLQVIDHVISKVRDCVAFWMSTPK